MEEKWDAKRACDEMRELHENKSHARRTGRRMGKDVEELKELKELKMIQKTQKIQKNNYYIINLNFK